MNDAARTKKQLIDELVQLRQALARLQAGPAGQPEPGASLRASETRYRRLFEAAQDGILILDASSGEIVDVNPFLTQLLGYSRADMVGRKLWEIGPFEDVSKSKVAFKDLQAHEYLRYEDLPLETRDGRSIAVEFVSNVYVADGQRVIQCNVRDITSRKQVETTLHLQAAALGATVNGIVITDRDGAIVWVNPAFTELTGYTATEALGRNPRDLVRSGQQDRAFYEELWATIVAGNVWRGELINRRKDGSLYVEEQSITPVRDARGEISHFVAVKQDITERRQAEEEVRARMQLAALRATISLSLSTVDSLPQALQRCAEALVTHLGAGLASIWTLDTAAGVLELQASAGSTPPRPGPYDRIALGEFDIGQIALGRAPRTSNAPMDNLDIAGRDWARQQGITAFAGHPLIVNDRVVGVMALFFRTPPSASVISTLAFVADHLAEGIERHHTTEALRASEERVRFALENANVGIWDADYRTGTITWSPILEAQYGLQPGTFGGTFEAFMALIHPDDREATIDVIRHAEQTGADFTTLGRAILPDGRIRWLSGAGRVALDARGKPIRGIGVSIDITERRTLEEQYQQAQKMEAVGRLAGGVAHDFNNLLTAILGYCELVLQDIPPDDPIRGNIEEIQKAGMTAAGLTRQLLTFSRKQIIDPELLDLNAVVAEMLPMLQRLIGEDVAVVLATHREPLTVNVDRGQLQQVVMNLAVNARDAMPAGGTLTIATAPVELDEAYVASHPTARPGDYAALSVTDTGTGMTPEVRDHLFEPFFTTKDVGKGTGLGLATIDGIVKQSGGSIGVYSEVGRGTSFNVYLPRSRAEAAPLRVAPATRHAEPHETVLVVEDAEELRELASKALLRYGYTVLVAADAREAMAVFDANPSIDVVLTDVVMPTMSGPELSRHLVARRPGLKVIFMSGYTEDAVVQHGVLKEGIVFMHKPFTPESLARKIREVLDS